MKTEMCEYCEGVVEAAVIRVPFHYQKETIYIDHVPVRKCRQCGEIYYEAAVYKRLEKIAANRRAIKKRITFPLADFTLAEAPRA
ncbi:MAG: YgiT-type zinc finger protein [Acidobacteria bacterium]|nr:YgiT-type zinc finger protein [Acidobacteriota bacterium]